MKQVQESRKKPKADDSVAFELVSLNRIPCSASLGQPFTVIAIDFYTSSFSAGPKKQSEVRMLCSSF